jgi:hypothetical protein
MLKRIKGYRSEIIKLPFPSKKRREELVKRNLERFNGIKSIDDLTKSQFQSRVYTLLMEKESATFNYQIYYYTICLLT